MLTDRDKNWFLPRKIYVINLGFTNKHMDGQHHILNARLKTMFVNSLHWEKNENGFLKICYLNGMKCPIKKLVGTEQPHGRAIRWYGRGQVVKREEI